MALPTDLSFQLPTTWNDGSALDPTKDLTGVRIGAGQMSGSYTKSVTDTALIPGSDGKVHYPFANVGLAPGTKDQTWFLAAFADASNGAESVASNEIQVTIPAKVPSPPSSFAAA